MSITDAIKDIEKHMGLEPDFSEYMNAPLPHNNQGYVQRDYKTGIPWIRCPWCGNKVFPINEETKIYKLPWKCKGSKCHKQFEINVK